jgi:hypothetical protein
MSLYGSFEVPTATVLSVDLTEQVRPLEVRETMLRETARAGVHHFEHPSDVRADVG